MLATYKEKWSEHLLRATHPLRGCKRQQNSNHPKWSALDMLFLKVAQANRRLNRRMKLARHIDLNQTLNLFD